MGEESDSFYVIEEGTVSVEASFVDIPLAQRAVSFPVNVASPSNGWCGSCKSPPPRPVRGESQMMCMLCSALPPGPGACHLTHCWQQPTASAIDRPMPVLSLPTPAFSGSAGCVTPEDWWKAHQRLGSNGMGV